jgi:transcriptional regulator with XRE-family HTH domain
MDNVDYIATRLKARREALGLSQRAVAELIGTSQSHISELETGKVHGIGINTAERWCRALGFRLHCELHDWGRAS